MSAGSYRRTFRHIGVLIVFLLIMSAGCSGPADRPLVREASAMNTYVTVSVYDTEITDDAAHEAVDEAFAEIRRVEAMASDYIDSSEVGRINAAAGLDSVVVSDELIALLRAAKAYGDLTGGLFDVTVGPLVRSWDFLAKHPAVPAPATLRELLTLVDYRKIVIGARTVYLPRRGMRIDLGAFGKGYALGRAAEILRAKGLRRVIVDIGGKLDVVWEGAPMFDTTGVLVEVRHPRRNGAFLGSFRVGNACVATSGDYERYFMVDGIRYHHILDPRSGMPRRGLVATTVIAADAMTADAYSTIVFLLGREEGLAVLNESPGLAGMVSWEEGDSVITELSAGMSRRFTPSSARD